MYKKICHVLTLAVCVLNTEANADCPQGSIDACNRASDYCAGLCTQQYQNQQTALTYCLDWVNYRNDACFALCNGKPIPPKPQINVCYDACLSPIERRRSNCPSLSK